MQNESNTAGDLPQPDPKIEPDYDDLPPVDFNPMWEVGIGLGILLATFAAVIAFS